MIRHAASRPAVLTPFMRALLALAFVVVSLKCVGAAGAQGLARYLDDIDAAALMPGAEGFGEIAGNPPAAPILRGGERVGYAFLTTDLVNATGYSGKPIHVVVGLEETGVITGARLVEHAEPIVLIGIPESRIRTMIDSYIGRNIVRETVEEVGTGDLDIIAGATVTVMVIDDSIRRAAVKLAHSRGIAGLSPVARRQGGAPTRLRGGEGEIRDWQALLGDGSVRRLTLSVGEVSEAFAETGEDAAAGKAEAEDPEALFIDLHAALVSVPGIGRSLLGEREFAQLRSRLAEGQHAFLLAGRGLFSFKGSGYVRGGVFDRFQLIQGDASIRFRDRQHKRLGEIAAAGAPDFSEVSLFVIPEGAEFDPAAPWRIELLASREIRPSEKAYTSFALSYRLPERYLAGRDAAVGRQRGGRSGPVSAVDAATAEERAARTALWQRVWQTRRADIAVLTVLLGVLTVIFFFQDWLVRRQRLMTWLRTGYLTVVLVWLGFLSNAQLSVVNTLTFANALITDFDWGYFLMAPLIFILWVGVAAGMLFWGRGPFCGWLCPYGALQELTNRIGRKLGIPQIELPWGLNERLWPVKYIIFLVLFGASFYSLALAETLAEVEPFKTAIILNFDRAWPFVAWAGGLIVVGLFIERFFCRYLCPLGAALALPGKLRMFDWLKRYRECGNPCQRCADICPTAAIHPDGRINVNECIYCLDCQKLYYDDQRCPHMIQDRLKRERRLLKSSDSALTDKQRAEKARLVARRRKAEQGAAGPQSSSTPASKETDDVGQDQD